MKVRRSGTLISGTVSYFRCYANSNLWQKATEMPLLHVHYPENSGIYFNKGCKFLEYFRALKLNFILQKKNYYKIFYYILFIKFTRIDITSGETISSHNNQIEMKQSIPHINITLHFF